MINLERELVTELGDLAEALPGDQDWSRSRTSSSKAFPQLSAEEEDEFLRHRFNGRLAVRLTGETTRRKSNVILLDDLPVIVPDADFKLLLRLVVGLHESDDGYVQLGTLKYGGGLAEEGILRAEGMYQAVSRLRARLDPALVGLDAKQFVEITRGRIRLSTHRAYISFDRERLLKHPDESVRLLAEHLPA